MKRPIKQILLVGGTGYIGRHLSAELEKEYDVWITGRHEPPSPDSRFLTLDLSSRDTFNALEQEPFDLIVFLAASVGGLDSISLAHPVFDVNAVHYRELLQFMADQGICSRLLYVSSMTVYAPWNALPVSESAHTLPLHSYGESKLIAETVTRFFCVRNGVPGMIVRLPGIFGGDRQSGYLYNIARSCMKDEPVDIDSSGLGIWEAMEMEDLCRALLLVIKKYDWSTNINVLNISYGEETDFIEEAFTIKRFCRSSSPVTVKKPLGYRPFYMDNTRLKSLTRFQGTFESGLERFLKRI